MLLKYVNSALINCKISLIAGAAAAIPANFINLLADAYTASLMTVKKAFLKIYPLAALILVLGTVLAIYFPVMDYNWVLGLDQVLLIDNVLIHHLGGNNLADIFLSTVEGRYEPLALLSMGTDMAIWPAAGMKAIHAGNLVLHCLNIILLYRLVWMISKNKVATLLSVALFALHPLNAEPVAWLSARSQLLGFFFLLLAMLAYLYHSRYPMHGGRYMRLSVLFFLLSVLSGPAGLAFPLILILYDGARGIGWRRSVKGKSLLLIVGVPALLVLLLVRAGGGLSGVSGWFTGKLMYFFYSSALWVISLIAPAGLVPYHPVPQQAGPYVVVLSLLILFLLVVAIVFRKKHKIVYTGLLSMLLLFFFGFVLTPGEFLYYDSQAYMPAAAFFIMAGLFIGYLAEQLKASRIAWPVITLLVIALLGWYALISAQRKALWNDNNRLWTKVIESYPDDGHAFYMRGDHWARSGDFIKARQDYTQCLHRNPQARDAVNNLGLIHMQEGDLRLAIREFNRALSIDSNFYKAYLNRGIVWMRSENNQRALSDMNRAIELSPGEALAYYNRALVYERMNALPDAINDLTKAISLNPYMIIFYKDRGKAFAWKSEFANAERDFTKAIELDPQNAELWFRRSLARSSQDKFVGGLEDAAMAKSLGFPVDEEYIKGLTKQVLDEQLEPSGN